MGSTPVTAARGFSNEVSEGIGRMSANLETRYLSRAALPRSPLPPPLPLFVPRPPLSFQAAEERLGPDLSFPLPSFLPQLSVALLLGKGRKRQGKRTEFEGGKLKSRRLLTPPINPSAPFFNPLTVFDTG